MPPQSPDLLLFSEAQINPNSIHLVQMKLSQSCNGSINILECNISKAESSKTKTKTKNHTQSTLSSLPEVSPAILWKIYILGIREELPQGASLSSGRQVVSYQTSNRC
jgi:hypothetical protein